MTEKEELERHQARLFGALAMKYDKKVKFGGIEESEKAETEGENFTDQQTNVSLKVILPKNSTL